MVLRSKTFRGLAVIAFAGLFFFLNISAGRAENESPEMSWDELEKEYASTSGEETSEQEKRRALEEQLSKQFASLSRSLSKLPHPPDMSNKEISFGKPANKKS